ncbi:hypothetical protein [Bosea sp. (in: a-proteobacteria)]|jgi:hypothetical protein|uniref:hypothetical protein n=1 Tax=Bosea sp. (in: a-proteobacteria) TaxID=1871050 RepID=UPI002DDDA007|nr:hypothetical protein [Bosea sp. (in: a-proteobacteria)]HEV2509680.1 hypothetical protein [Bosea sp. (in: a-proteobacteria)]
MALVPGLRSGLQERPEGGRNTGRVVVTEDGVPKNKRLQPTASPIETYTRPAALPKNNDAERLIASLAGVNPALLRLGETLKEEDKDKHAAVNAKLATMKAEDVRTELRDNPTGELATSLKTEKAQELFAAKMAQDDVVRWQEEWATGAKDGVDVEAFLRERVDARLKENGATGQRFTNEYLRLVTPGMNTIRSGQLKHNVQRAEETMAQATSALLERTIANGVSEGKKPDDIAAAVRAEITGNKMLAGRDASWQEGEVLNIAKRYAEQGNVELVTALVNSKGANGFSLTANREHGSSATKLLEMADSKRREKNREGNSETLMRLYDQSRDGSLKDEEVEQLFKYKPGLISAETVSSLKARNKAVIEKRLEEQQKLFTERQNKQKADDSDVSMRAARVGAMNDGTLHRLGPTTQYKEDGTTKEIDAEKNKEAAVEQWLEISTKTAERNGENPDQRFERELPVFRQNGVVHPEWKSTMSRGIKTISAVTTTGDKLPGAFTEGYKRYSELRTKAPELLTAHLSKDERENWETVRVMVEDIGMDPSKAALQFNTMIKDPVKFRELLGEGTRQDILQSVDREFSGATNKGHIMQQVHKRAFVFAGAGLSPKDATKRAVEEFKRTNTKINGHYLDTSDRAVPPDFAELAKAHIDDYVRKHGKREKLDADDITLEPVSGGTGGWVLRNTHTGDILDNPNDRLITTDTLMKIKGAREDAAKAALTTRADKRREQEKTIQTQRDDWNAAQQRARDVRMGIPPDPARSGN